MMAIINKIRDFLIKQIKKIKKDEEPLIEKILVALVNFVTKDWVVRAAKTFVQSFLGVLIPEFCIILNNGFPENLSVVWAALLPSVPAALAAAISALWNYLLEKSKNSD